MKPIHVGLLVTGAALSGGLAVKMTQPPMLPVAAAAPSARQAPPGTKGADARVANATPAPDRKSAAAAESDSDPGATAAPPPVYEEPPHNAAQPSAGVKNVSGKSERSTAYRKPFPENAAPESPKHVELAKAEPIATVRPEPYQPGPGSVPAASPASEAPVESAASAHDIAATPQAPARQVTLRSGTAISVRLSQTLSTDHVSPGDSFQATLSEPIVAEGLVIAERGARISGRVIDARRAGRLSGTSMIQLGLLSVQTADGQGVAISTEPWSKQADASNSAEAAKIGGGAVLGAIIGAITGGGKGAAIGAGVGGGAGVGAAAATGARPVSIPTETQIRFRLASNVTITERQNY